MQVQQVAAPERRFDAFISYSHHDRAAVQGLQRALQRIARPLGRRHALRVFRDETDLTASPDLWAGVAHAMDQARFLVVAMSPASAGSFWVNREIEHWLRTRGSDGLLLVLVGGTVSWNRATGAFAPEWSNATPRVLASPGSLPNEPLYIDISNDAPWDTRSAAFRSRVTGLAAAIHQVSPRELETEDLRERRRRAWVRRAVTGAMAVLTALSMILFLRVSASEQEARRAEQAALELRSIAEAKQVAARAEAMRGSNNALSIALAREAAAITAQPIPEALRALADAKAAFAEEPLQVRQPLIDAHRGSVYDLAFAPDGDLFVTTGADNAVRLWSRNSNGQVGADLASPSDQAIYDVAMNGTIIAAAGVDRILLWNAQTRAALPSIPIDGSPHALDVDAEGIRIAWATSDRVQVRDVRTGETLWTKTAKDVKDVAFDAKDTKLAVGSDQGLVELLNLSDGRKIWGATIKDAAVITVAFRQEGDSQLAVGCDDRRIHLFDFNDDFTKPEKSTKSTFSGHNSSLFALSFADTSYLISGSADGSVGLWDTDVGEQVGQPRSAGVGRIEAMDYSSESRALATGGGDGRVALWDYRSIPWQSNKVSALAASPTADLTITAGAGRVVVWEGTKKSRTITVGGKIWALAFLPDGRRFVTAGEDRAPAIWDASSGTLVGDLEYPASLRSTWINDIIVSADGATVLSADGSGSILSWSVETRTLKAAKYTDDSSLLGIAPSPDGRLLAYGGRSGRLILRNVRTGEIEMDLKIGPGASVTDVAFTSNGQFLAAANSSGTVRIVNVAARQVVRELHGPRDRVDAIALSPDGGQLAATSAKDGVWVWAVADGTVLVRLLQSPVDPAPFPRAMPNAQTVQFSADGRSLIVGDDYDVRTWAGLLDTKSGCEIATQYVTKEQVAQFLPADWTAACQYAR